jgi:hypothetical protein
MTPAQTEAKRIFDQYYNLMFFLPMEARIEFSKKCALIDWDNTNNGRLDYSEYSCQDDEFYQEVKAQLEKL